MYIDNHAGREPRRSGSLCSNGQNAARGEFSSRQPGGGALTTGLNQSTVKPPEQKKCFVCSSTKHLRSQCPSLKSGNSALSASRPNSAQHGGNEPKRVYSCRVESVAPTETKADHNATESSRPSPSNQQQLAHHYSRANASLRTPGSCRRWKIEILIFPN